MENGFLLLSNALKLMAQKDARGMFVPFDIEYRTFNEQTKKGGKLKKYYGVKYLPDAKQSSEQDVVDAEKQLKAPNHFKNRTRNIELATGEIKTIRIDFIVSINNTNVIY